MTAATPSGALLDADLPGARVRFSTRVGGVSEGPYGTLNVGLMTGDRPERVATNRRRVAAAAGLDPAAIALARQVHGTELLTWDQPPPDPFDDVTAARPEADGHLTDVPGVGLAVQVADCLPVALAGGGRVAMLHCGWRGLAAGIVARAVAALGPASAAMIGPGIGRCCFEVGPEVLARFADVDGAASGRMLDLRMVAEARLRAAGVERVEHVDLCTHCRDDLLYSHRRDGAATGRQCAIAWLP